MRISRQDNVKKLLKQADWLFKIICDEIAQYLKGDTQSSSSDNLVLLLKMVINTGITDEIATLALKFSIEVADKCKKLYCFLLLIIYKICGPVKESILQPPAIDNIEIQKSKFIELLNEYLQSDEFQNTNFLFSKFLKLVLSIAELKDDIIKVLKQHLENKTCSFPTFLIIFLCKYYRKQNDLDSLIFIINTYQSQLKQSDFSELDFAKEALKSRTAELTGQAKEYFCSSQWKEFTYIKHVIESAGQALQDQAQLSIAFEKLGDLIKLQKTRELIDYLAEKSEQHPKAYEMLIKTNNELSKKKKENNAAIKILKEHIKKISKKWTYTDKGIYAKKLGNLPLARREFKFACHERDSKAYPHYVSMCYRGEGDKVNISEALRVAKSCVDIREIPDVYKLDFGELYHVMSLSSKREPEKSTYKTQAQQFYEFVTANDNSSDNKNRATLNRKILHEDSVVPPSPLTESTKTFAEDKSDDTFSEDSDEEDCKAYQKVESHYLKRFPTKLDTAIKKIISEALAILTNFEADQVTQSTEDKMNSAFVPEIVKFHPKTATISSNIQKDVLALCHGAQASKSEEQEDQDLAAKLAEMETAKNYYVSVTRGIHFDVNRWSREERQHYRKRIRNRELQRYKIYCHAAYIQAQVNFGDVSELALRKLAIAEKYIQFCMEKLNESPYTREELPRIADGFTEEDIHELQTLMVTREFDSKYDQIQHLYSNRYDLFHKFIAWESKRPNAVFPNAGSPFVSTADYGTIAPFEYAIGNKYYQGHEDSRLKPRYTQDGRPTRPYSGAVALSVLKVEDLLQSHAHAPSMNRDGLIQLEQLIFSERETSFIGSLPGEITFCYAARFPNFSTAYYPAFYLKYGFNEELFNKFKALLVKFENHSKQQRLLIKFLGRYLSAFHSLCLQQEAVDQVRERDGFLFFRNPHGGFSVIPSTNNDINPTPQENSTRTAHTRLVRAKRKLPQEENLNQDEHPLEKSSASVAANSASFHNRHKRKLSSDSESIDDDEDMLSQTHNKQSR